MKNLNFRFYSILLLILGTTFILNNPVSAQPAGTSNFFDQIKTYNLATLWRADRLKLISLKRTEDFPEPYGILGKNNQRFYIHYTSVVKDPANPYRYNVQGKTRVGNQIHPFTGTITVTKAGIYKPGNNPYAPEPYKGYKRGELICRIAFNEAGSTPGAGSINGELTTEFCINAQNQLQYDTLDFGIDGYQNNAFTGSWTATGSKTTQKLQYGDYNLAGSDFSEVDGITVPPQYEKYGWQNFVKATSNSSQPEGKAAIAEEKRQWWK